MAKTKQTKQTKQLGAETKPKTTKKAKAECSVEITFNGQTYKGEGKTLAEVLGGFVQSPLFPVGLKTVTVLKYRLGSKEGTRVMHVPEARRIFSIIALKPSALELFAGKLQ